MYFVSFSLLQIVLIYEYQFGFMLNENGLTLFFHIFELISIFQSNFQLNGSEFSSIIQHNISKLILNIFYILKWKFMLKPWTVVVVVIFVAKGFFFIEIANFFHSLEINFMLLSLYLSIFVNVNCFDDLNFFLIFLF